MCLIPQVFIFLSPEPEREGLNPQLRFLVFGWLRHILTLHTVR